MKKETQDKLKLIPQECVADILVRVIETIEQLEIVGDTTPIIAKACIIMETISIQQSNDFVLDMLTKIKFPWQQEYSDMILDIAVNTHLKICDKSVEKIPS